MTRFLLVSRCNGIILRLSKTITLELFEGLMDFIHLQSEQQTSNKESVLATLRTINSKPYLFLYIM